jgi:N5-(cytidine 5'-diphosphoramidyl)-L-glutamine hydrolase
VNLPVGISMRVMVSRDYGEARDAISHDWIRYLDDLNVTPILIPNGLADPVALAEHARIQALLFTGGGDVSPSSEEGFNGQEPMEFERYRDMAERRLLEWALAIPIPVFGVCRGMQALNVLFGGQIIRDLGGICGSPDAHLNTRHEIHLVDSPYGIFREDSSLPVFTNSFHRQAIARPALAPPLRAFAMAGDGIVEGLYHPRFPLFGVQWHPERVNSAREIDQRLLTFWRNWRSSPCT